MASLSDNYVTHTLPATNLLEDAEGVALPPLDAELLRPPFAVEGGR